MKYPPIKNWKSCNQANVQFNQSQISSDRLNISELGCLLHPLRMWFFITLNSFFFFSCLWVLRMSADWFLKGWVKSFQDQTCLINLLFDSLTRWLMIPWQERLIIVWFPHRAIYHNCRLLKYMLLYVWKLAFLTSLACAKFKRVLTYKRGQKG